VQTEFEHDDFAEVWRIAQRRRFDDASLWFTCIHRRRLQPRTAVTFVGALLRSLGRRSGSLILAQSRRAARRDVRNEGGRSEC
jgi:hypothetical protein